MLNCKVQAYLLNRQIFNLAFARKKEKTKYKYLACAKLKM